MNNFFYTKPNILKETARGIDHCPIGDDMLSRREVSVVGSIDQEMAYDICQQLRYLERDSASAPVTVFVDSPGGTVGAGLAIYDVMRSLACPVNTVCLDMAASMGSIIFQAGVKRSMYPHAEVMIHDPLIGQNAGGNALAIKERADRLLELRDILTGILAERSGHTLEEIQEMTAKDTYLSAEEAVEMGFADEVCGQPKPVRK